MKPILSLATLALLCAPSFALADVGSTASGQPPAAFAQVRSQMMQLHTQERAQMLNALTPAHRTMLSNLAGQLATSANPNADGAARTLDASLSRGEAQSILRIHQTFRSESEQLMQNARNQYEATLSPEQRQAMAARMAARQSHLTGATSNNEDAGRLLLRMASAHGGMMGHGMR